CVDRSLYPRHLPSFPTRRSSDLDTLAAGLRATDFGTQLDVEALLGELFRGFLGHIPVGHEQEIVHCFQNSHLGSESRPHAAKLQDRKSTRLNSSHVKISYAVFWL